MECGRESKFIRFIERNHKFTVKDKPAKGYYVVRRETDKIQATTRLEKVWPKFGEKQEEANEKPKLDNPRRTRGISFIDPED